MALFSAISAGRPCTPDLDYSQRFRGIDDNLITDLPEETVRYVVCWILSNIRPRKNVNKDYDSYTLKHMLESDLGIYLTNNQFKDAMLFCGFCPVKVTDVNWMYCIKNVDSTRRCSFNLALERIKKAKEYPANKTLLYKKFREQNYL